MKKSGSKHQWCGRETTWLAYKRQQTKPSSRLEASGWQDTDVRIVSRDEDRQ